MHALGGYAFQIQVASCRIRAYYVVDEQIDGITRIASLGENGQDVNDCGRC